MASSRKFFWVGCLLILATFALDQASKWYVLTDLMNPPKEIPVTSFFSFVLAWNTGVSFSLFNSYGDLGTFILCGVAIVISLFFLGWLWRAQNYWLGCALGLIIGGAMGNLVDRMRFGAVVDFLHFYYQTYAWPAFNLADTFITIGVMLIFVESFLCHKGEKNA
jgi:signal peptidase II